MRPLSPGMRTWPVVPALILTALAGVLEASAPGRARAHEEGVIHIDPERAAVGSRITIRGEKFGEEVRLEIRLKGILETRRLAEVVTDDEGAFLLEISLPDGAGSGRYVLIAVAPDGDVVARADLEIVAPSEADGTVGEAEGGPHVATDADMPIETERGAVEWIVVVAFFLACGLGGLGLLRAGPR